MSLFLRLKKALPNHQMHADRLNAGAFRVSSLRWAAGDLNRRQLSNLFQVSPDPIPLQISKFRPCEINSGAVADTNTISQL